MFDRLKDWWNGLPDKKVVVAIPVKLAVACGAGLLLLTVALSAARRVEAQFGASPATYEQVQLLAAQVAERCKSQKR
jgi:hypothetical protein